jgi:DNA-binding response OmpR family regulator
MDLRVVVLIGDRQMGELVRAQVENLGCRCSVVDTYDAASAALVWAEAAIIDLAEDGVDHLNRLRVEAPTVRTLAITPDAELRQVAEETGVDQVLVEPFSVAELVEAVRALGRGGSAEVVDLRPGERASADTDDAPADDVPWWATKTH